MLITKFRKGGALAIFIAGILAATPSLADKPPWAGGGKGGKHGQKDWHENREGNDWAHGGKPPHEQGGQAVRERGYFDDHHRVIVHDYYAGQFQVGRCPPGLAKKHNGCVPPGQAKKWAMGQPLPRDVVIYGLPSTIIGQIGMPPAGYRYVRVANDILLISTGTRMVVDAILDLGGM